MKRFYNIICLMLLLIFTACEYDSDITIPKAESKLVISSFISPSDSIVRVYLQQTLRMEDQTTNPDVEVAIVTISNGTDTTTLSYSFDERAFMDYYTIEAGKTYTIRAETPDGRWAEGSCKVIEDQNLNFEFTLDSVVSSKGTVYKLAMEWQDIAATTQAYYRTDAELTYIVLKYEDSLQSPDFSYYLQELTSPQEEVKRGIGAGQKMTMNYESYLIEKNSIFKNFEIHLLMIDEQYYKFEKTKKSSLNLPFSEPYKLYSNIKNGYGIIASYNNHIVKSLYLE